MAAIHGRNTSPELVVRRFLYSRGLRYRIHCANLPGRPDVVIRRLQAVVFIHGCFWHQHVGCRYAVMPKTNRPFWIRKLGANQLRDRRATARLRRTGWHVFTIWECEIGKRELVRLYRRIASLSGRRHQLRAS